jgi:hypothetical protein
VFKTGHFFGRKRMARTKTIVGTVQRHKKTKKKQTVGGGDKGMPPTSSVVMKTLTRERPSGLMHAAMW